MAATTHQHGSTVTKQALSIFAKRRKVNHNQDYNTERLINTYRIRKSGLSAASRQDEKMMPWTQRHRARPQFLRVAARQRGTDVRYVGIALWPATSSLHCQSHPILHCAHSLSNSPYTSHMTHHLGHDYRNWNTSFHQEFLQILQRTLQYVERKTSLVVPSYSAPSQADVRIIVYASPVLTTLLTCKRRACQVNVPKLWGTMAGRGVPVWRVVWSAKKITFTNQDILQDMLLPYGACRRNAERTAISREAVSINHDKIATVQEIVIGRALEQYAEGLRMEFCSSLVLRYHENRSFLQRIMFTDVATFNSDGHVNIRNIHYWAADNPHWLQPAKHERHWCVNVWCDIIGDHVPGPYFLAGTVTDFTEFTEECLMIKSMEEFRRHRMILKTAFSEHVQRYRKELFSLSRKVWEQCGNSLGTARKLFGNSVEIVCIVRFSLLRPARANRDEKPAARELTSGRKSSDCTHQSSEEYDSRLD
ncbi:hypothetical protein PR048_029847 [Dryococelus australis]|uniref:Uncharacterized protein n=1 Tax=Dryococelus australis TaxID=614101 RepID=A0ABQ9G9Y3_9NEOP|nr:hypothetical protein PR048_029847 [Dryococelus australis]